MQGRGITVHRTKTGSKGIIPMSGRLHGVLEMAHTALAAALPEFDHERDRADHIRRCYVFGDGIGHRVAVIRKAWDTAVLKAHGHQPVWCGSNTLAPASRAVLRGIDLHFHDLRHEAGSRFIEAGWPIHHVQNMLGHADLSQTPRRAPSGTGSSLRMVGTVSIWGTNSYADGGLEITSAGRV